MKTKFYLLLLFIIITHTSFSQLITYKNLEPNLSVTQTRTPSGTSNKLELDITNDGNIDIKINTSNSSDLSAFIESTEDSNIEVLRTPSITYFYDYNNEINPNNIPSSCYFSTSSILFSSSFSSWEDPLTKYICFRLKNDENQYYYGWIEMTMNIIVEDYLTQEFTLSINSFAYYNIPNQSILAGQTTSNLQFATNAVTSVSVADVNDNGDGKDLEVGFPKAENEKAAISEYRILVTKVADSYDFDLEAANNATHYFSVEPKEKNNYLTVLDHYSKDIDGDRILTDINYKVFVLSVANGKGANVNALSEPSESIKLVGGIASVNYQNSDHIKVYPNPAINFVNIKNTDIIDRIDVYNISGQFIFSNNNIKSDSYKLDVSSFNKGFYNIIIYSKNSKFIKEIIIQ